MRICDLREKEVINICDGERLGFVEDVEFDLCTGKITHIIVPGPCKFFGVLGREEEYVIEICHICKIGTDLILARYKQMWKLVFTSCEKFDILTVVKRRREDYEMSILCRRKYESN